MGDEYTEIDVRTMSQTALAVRFHDGDNKFWIPQSLMLEWPEEGTTGTALVKTWFLRKEGII